MSIILKDYANRVIKFAPKTKLPLHFTISSSHHAASSIHSIAALLGPVANLFLFPGCKNDGEEHEWVHKKLVNP